jgi:Arylsulfatase A and related enzymes
MSFFFLIYLILWLLVVPHLNRFLKLGTIPLAVLLALILALFFILTLLNNLTHVYSPPINLSKLSAILLVYLLISIGTYFAAKSITEAASYRTSAVAFGFALPFVLAEIMLVMWLYAYRIDLFPSNSSFFAFTGCFLIVLLTILLFYGIVRRVSISRLFTFFTVLVVLIPFMALAVIKGPKVLSEVFKGGDHRIRHVVLLTVDTLRADVLSCYGNERSASTPNIDRLAQDSVLFTKRNFSRPVDTAILFLDYDRAFSDGSYDNKTLIQASG